MKNRREAPQSAVAPPFPLENIPAVVSRQPSRDIDASNVRE